MWAATVLVTLFAGASLLADTLRPRWRPVPLMLLGAALFAIFLELTRHDHGHGEAYFWLGYVLAPVVLIFGGAAFGSRRFYGWPDLGAVPSRAAFISLCILLGVLVGVQMRGDDIGESTDRAAHMRVELRSWRDANGGTWPPSLDAALDPVPRTSLGALNPPPYDYGRDARGNAVLAIPLGVEKWYTLDLESGKWNSRPVPPRPAAGSGS